MLEYIFHTSLNMIEKWFYELYEGAEAKQFEPCPCFKFDLELGVILKLWVSANWFKKRKFLSQDRSRNDNIRMDKQVVKTGYF